MCTVDLSLVTWSSPISGKVKSYFKIISPRLPVMPIVTRLLKNLLFVHWRIKFQLIFMALIPFPWLIRLILHLLSPIPSFGTLNFIWIKCFILQFFDHTMSLTLLWFCTCYFFWFSPSHPTGKVSFIETHLK